MDNTNPDFKRFLYFLGLVLLTGVASVTLFVAIVDPYGLYSFIESDKFNAVKPGLNRYQAEIKQERARRLRPDFVILGNSRAEIGLDPKAPAFGHSSARGFNLAIPGTGIDTSSRQLAELHGAGINPKIIILGVEFIDFLRAAAPPKALAISAAVPTGSTLWRFNTLFSLASVKDSIRTLRIQHDEEAATVDRDGFNPLKEYRGYVREEGYYNIFQQRALENSRTYRHKAVDTLSTGDFQYLSAILATAGQMRAEVKLVIYPYHAQILAMFEEAGLWPLFEEWKRQLVEQVGAANRNNPDTRIVLVDFSGFGQYNCERIPTRNEVRGTTQWYWEAGHFKKELGDIVLDRLISASPRAGDPSFGMVLDASTQAINADRIASERRACAAAQPDLFQLAKKMIAMARTAG